MSEAVEGGKRRGSSLRGVLAVVEKHGSVVLPARNVEKLASVDARVALRVAGVLASAPAAATWPCDVRGCSREIRSNYDGAQKPLVAVCCQVPSACAPVELGFEDVAHQEIRADALASAACALFGATADRASLAKVREARPLGDARAPILLAAMEEDEPARDVFWAGSPRDTDVASFCTRRERVTRGTVVLVPTAERVPLETLARFAPGEHVEVRALADAIEVRDGVLAIVDGGTPPARELAMREQMHVQPESPPAPGIAARIGATSWEAMRLTVVDGHTIRIEANGKTVLTTFVELGLVDGRKTDVVTPVRAWALLVLFCKRGVLQPSEYGELGKAFAAKKAIEVLGKAMRAAFGLEEHPIKKYARRTASWVPRFRVGMKSGDD